MTWLQQAKPSWLGKASENLETISDELERDWETDAAFERNLSSSPGYNQEHIRFGNPLVKPIFIKTATRLHLGSHVQACFKLDWRGTIRRPSELVPQCQDQLVTQR
ncbi:hypothetical protein BKA70DRAFT_1215990 [Coprinopsis sp. MPI-PUGE-AT-0042]|nr:hypothetical protein BKA70DRAFT_1215990 [Coprinopsis sp. MPI-PUGE-AT-0042]